MDSVKLFVIVVTYKGYQWYERCFQSLRKSNLPIQTIVIDNASNDGTVEYIREQFPEIILIESKENLGFGRANNLGMRYALDNDCDYVFLLNQDAWIEPNTLEELIYIHQKNPEYGILSPMHINKSRSSIEKGLLRYITNHNITDSKLISDMFFNNLGEIYNTIYVNAAAWLLPASTLYKVGGFDPIFSHYGEDDNYLQRVLYHGNKVGICPKQLVVHDTERRLNNKKIHTSNAFVLSILTDVNNEGRRCNFFVTFLRTECIRMFKSLLKGNFSSFKLHKNQLLFAIHKRRQIFYSIKQNKKCAPSWL